MCWWWATSKVIKEKQCLHIALYPCIPIIWHIEWVSYNMIKTIVIRDCFFFERIMNLIAHRIMLNHRLTFTSLWIRLVTSVYVMSDVRGWIHVGFWILWWCIVLVLFISMLPTCGSTYRVEYTFLGTRPAKEQIAVEGPFKTVQLWFCKVFTSKIRTVLNQRISWAIFEDRFKNLFKITSRASALQYELCVSHFLTTECDAYETELYFFFENSAVQSPSHRHRPVLVYIEEFSMTFQDRHETRFHEGLVNIALNNQAEENIWEAHICSSTRRFAKSDCHTWLPWTHNMPALSAEGFDDAEYGTEFRCGHLPALRGLRT